MSDDLASLEERALQGDRVALQALLSASVQRGRAEHAEVERQRREHLHYFQSMDQINRALHGTDDFEQVLSEVQDAVLSIFECDRAFLLYPCDPQAPTWCVPVERTRPERPGAFALGSEIPMDPDLARVLRTTLAADGPVAFGGGSPHPLPHDAAARFDIRSILGMALRPKIGKPWMFGIHQCSHARVWTEEEERLFREIGRRLEDALGTLLVYRDQRVSEQRYRMVFENSPLSLWEEDLSQVKGILDGLRRDGVVDLDAYLDVHPEIATRCAEAIVVDDLNRSALNLHGARSKDELLASVVDTFTPETFGAFREELLCVWNGVTELETDAVVQTLAGERREVTVFFSVCPGYESSYGKVLVSLVDISERQRAEAEVRGLNAALEERVRQRTRELADSEERFRTFFERQVVGMAFTSPDKGWLQVNDRLCEMTGYSRQELAQVTWADITFADDLLADLEQFERLTSGDIDGYALEKRFVRKDGELVYTNLSVGCVRRADGAVDYALALLEDITERKRGEQSIRELNAELSRRAAMLEAANKHLEAANKELEAFSYSVSHDLRAPVRAVQGFSRILHENHAGSMAPEAAQLLDIVHSSAIRMGRLIDDLLTFSRMSRQPLNCRPVSPERLIGPIVSQLRAEVPETRRIDVEVHPLPPCQADSALLTQLFTNLLSNAFKYTRPRDPAVIEIGAQAGSSPGEVVYYVKDNGVGFDMRYAHKLFGVFQRLHGVDEFEGIGAGLAIVQRIALRHGGRVWAEAVLDKGATFFVALERAEAGPT